MLILINLRGPYRYDVAPDGRRFLFSEPPEETPELAMWVVQNWFTQFRDGEQD